MMNAVSSPLFLLLALTLALPPQTLASSVTGDAEEPESEAAAAKPSASPKIDKQKLMDAVAKAKAELEDANLVFQAQSDAQNGRYVVKAAEMAKIATIGSFLFYAYRVMKYTDVGQLENGDLVQLGILMTAISGATWLGTGTYVHMTNQEYRDSKDKVAKLQQELGVLEQELNSLNKK
jgi:hypothetical protein